MKQLAFLLVFALAPLAFGQDGWISLFNGKDLSGWKVNENVETFSVKDGVIVAHGRRSHCFYAGDVKGHSFTDFELMVEAKTAPDSNGGIYILTEFQERGWPGKGFEVQVNNSLKNDPRKTGSLYEVQDINENLVPDDEWFTEHIVVKDNRITVKVNGKQVVDWTQPADWRGTSDFPERRIGPGTIALQGHDPGSTVYYRNIRIKPLN